MPAPWRNRDAYTDGAVYTDTATNDDPECGCAHPVSLHDGPAGQCTGKGRDMRDMADYPWIGPDDACVCTRYEGSVD